MPTIEELQRLYNSATDDEVSHAYAAGLDAYTPVSWQIIAAEFQRRGLAPLATAIATADGQHEASLVTADSAAQPPLLTLAALEGQKQLRAIAGVVLVTYLVVSGVVVLLVFSLSAVFFALLRFGFLLVICESLREGRAWARWLTAATTLVTGLFWLSTAGGWIVVQPLIAALTAAVGILYLGISWYLVSSGSIAEYTRARTTDARHNDATA
jgi:hypothetical protein